jgi:superfamily II DNA or RNA helicase
MNNTGPGGFATGAFLSMKVTVSSYAWLPKAELTIVQQQALKAKLTIVPRKVGNHPGPPPAPVYLFKETDQLLGIAREFFSANRKEHHEVDLQVTGGDKTAWSDLSFAATLRSEQAQALEVLAHEYGTGRLGAMIRASPGWGKTVFACALMAKLQVPTLVIVHKEFLMKQWKERIEQFLPDAKVGICQGDVCDFEGKHVVIAMVHSLSQRTYPLEFLRWPGLMIVDECHRIGAATWAPVPAYFPTRYRLGLSATPRRKDGAENVFFYHLGPIIFSAKEQRMHPKIRKVYSDFHLAATDRLNPALISKPLLLRFLCASTKRNEQIIEQLRLAVISGRKILVLSERLEHLTTLEQMLKDSWGNFSKTPAPTTGQYVGGMKEEDYEESSGCQVIFATAQLVSEGFDLPALDTLFLTTPVSDAEQAVGRILRPFEGKKEPVVVDFRDDRVGLCLRAAEYREKLYAKIC